MNDMERKGLSQILYLIIAASVLMMIAMVITFTATDTIGGVGSDSQEQECTSSIQGLCTATGNTAVDLPSSCVSEDQSNLIGVAPSRVGTGVVSGSVSGSYTGGPASNFVVACQ